MKKDIVLASKYVAALKEQVKGDELLPVLETVHTAAKYIYEEDRVFQFMTSPLTSVEQKTALAEKIIQALNGGKSAKQFMSILIRKKRVELVKVLPKLLEDLRNEVQGQIEVNVLTPFECSDESKKQFLSVLQKVIQKEIKSNFIEDANIIGGFRAQIDNTLFDGTINNALNKLKENLSR
jgi:ATP synthase F1 delta subunit